MTRNEKYFFMAVNEKNEPGCIRVCNYPLSDKVHEIQSHNTGITKMIIDKEDKKLFTASEDGTLIVYEIKDQ